MLKAMGRGERGVQGQWTVNYYEVLGKTEKEARRKEEEGPGRYVGNNLRETQLELNCFFRVVVFRLLLYFVTGDITIV